MCGVPDKVYKLRVGGPHKIMNIWCSEVPRKGGSIVCGNLGAGCFIAKAYLIRVLQISRTADHVVFIDGNAHVIIPPYAVKFTRNVRSGMPSFIIILAH